MARTGIRSVHVLPSERMKVLTHQNRVMAGLARAKTVIVYKCEKCKADYDAPPWVNGEPGRMWCPRCGLRDTIKRRRVKA